MDMCHAINSSAPSFSFLCSTNPLHTHTQHSGRLPIHGRQQFSSSYFFFSFFLFFFFSAGFLFFRLDCPLTVLCGCRVTSFSLSLNESNEWNSIRYIWREWNTVTILYNRIRLMAFLIIWYPFSQCSLFFWLKIKLFGRLADICNQVDDVWRAARTSIAGERGKTKRSKEDQFKNS